MDKRGFVVRSKGKIVAGVEIGGHIFVKRGLPEANYRDAITLLIIQLNDYIDKPQKRRDKKNEPKTKEIICGLH